jgi:hypothetical protein
MNLVVAKTKDVAAKDWAQAVDAVKAQVAQHFGPAWSVAATVSAHGAAIDFAAESGAIVADAIVYVTNFADDPDKVEDALGYHSRTNAGVPFGFVFIDVVEKFGESWTVTLSHEVMELLLDPDVNLMVMAPHPADPHPADPQSLVLRPYEVADPVQGDSYQVAVGETKVLVSNFVLPKYFIPAYGSSPVDWMKTDLQPFGVRRGGYFDYFDFSAGKWERVFGSSEARAMNARREWTYGLARRASRHTARALAGSFRASIWTPP